MTEAAPLADESGNAKAYSVSELAFALKRTLEDAYGFVRLRGELSKVTNHSNGHVYLTIKDERAAIDGVLQQTFPEQRLVVDAPLQMQRAVDDLARQALLQGLEDLARQLNLPPAQLVETVRAFNAGGAAASFVGRTLNLRRADLRTLVGAIEALRTGTTTVLDDIALGAAVNRENLDAVDFLRHLTSVVRREQPGVALMAVNGISPLDPGPVATHTTY